MLVVSLTAVGLTKSRLPVGWASQASESPTATWVIFSPAAKTISVEFVVLPTMRTTFIGL